MDESSKYSGARNSNSVHKLDSAQSALDTVANMEDKRGQRAHGRFHASTRFHFLHPSHPGATQTTQKDSKLTIAEAYRRKEIGYNACNVDPRTLTDSYTLWTVDTKQTLVCEDMKTKFEPHPDTAFMLGPPHFAIPAPKPTAEYIRAASEKDPTRLETYQPILLILDLNGTLLFRPSKKRSDHFQRRRHLDEFLGNVFESFHVMFWTTAQPANAHLMLEGLLSTHQIRNVVALWDRLSFGLTSRQYNQKIVVYKHLEWVWNDDRIQRRHPYYLQGGRWSQSNTILVDDSAIKATAQPFNHILVPEFKGPDSDRNIKCGSVLEQVAGYLDVVSSYSNVSAYMKAFPFKVDEAGYLKPLWPQPGPENDRYDVQAKLTDP
ncbi:uncharacterized protein PV09_09177 [Verruconis gallopava]|uniref:Mitochondrial import inner membrane translocase subunit TIM50 n=1 Tax=Verruconis gallopava TaxID=253628 RepID=A0A0D1ZXG7_9PEZI|nr:uncharacterized protein PV09_09177 [Verruconis gallopava]KIV99147.1 hypothetical protein PV09_09177 [Verruconis gallopava]